MPDTWVNSTMATPWRPILPAGGQLSLELTIRGCPELWKKMPG